MFLDKQGVIFFGNKEVKRTIFLCDDLQGGVPLLQIVCLLFLSLSAELSTLANHATGLPHTFDAYITFKACIGILTKQTTYYWEQRKKVLQWQRASSHYNSL